MVGHKISHAKPKFTPQKSISIWPWQQQSMNLTQRHCGRSLRCGKHNQNKNGNNVVKREREKSRINCIISASTIFKQRAPYNSTPYKSSERIKIFNVWVSGYHFYSPPHSHTFSAHNVISIKNVEWSRCSALHCEPYVGGHDADVSFFFLLFRQQSRCWSIADRNNCQFQRAYLSTLK